MSKIPAKEFALAVVNSSFHQLSVPEKIQLYKDAYAAAQKENDSNTATGKISSKKPHGIKG